MLAQLLAVVAPVFLAAGVGFAWAKSGRGFDTNHMTPIITTIGTPCLVVHTLLDAAPAPSVLAQMLMAGIVAHVAAGLIGFAVLKAGRLPIRTFLPALTFANNGNMGLPLCLFAFGQEGLALAIGYFVVSAVGQFTAGYAIAAGTFDPRRLARTPLVWAVLVAVLLMATETDLPLWAMNTLELIGQFTIPMMLLALGVSLARLSVSRAAVPILLSAVRLGGGLAVAVLLVWALELDGAARGVVILQGAMPTAVFNYLFAQYHGNRPEEVAGLVVVSTLASVALLPAVLAFVL